MIGKRLARKPRQRALTLFDNLDHVLVELGRLSADVRAPTDEPALEQLAADPVDTAHLRIRESRATLRHAADLMGPAPEA